MRPDDGGNGRPFFLVPKLVDSSTLQDAENEKFQTQREALIFYAFSYMTLLYSVQYEFLGRGPGSTLRAAGGWIFFEFFFQGKPEYGPIWPIIFFGPSLLKNSVPSNPKIATYGSKCRGGVSYLGPVGPPYGHFRTGYSVVPENPIVTGLKDKHGYIDTPLRVEAIVPRSG